MAKFQMILERIDTICGQYQGHPKFQITERRPVVTSTWDSIWAAVERVSDPKLVSVPETLPSKEVSSYLSHNTSPLTDK